MLRTTLLVGCAAALLACASAAGAPVRYEFAATFISTPVNGVNHAVAHSTTLSSNFTADGVEFGSSVNPGGLPMIWTSKTLNVDGDSWAEIGTLTLVGQSSNSTLNFKSIGNSGHQGPAIPGKAGFSYGAISYMISGGTGQFSGANGVMVDMFTADPGVSSFPINAWAIFFVPA